MEGFCETCGHKFVEVYDAEVTCENCDHKEVMKVPKGKTVREFKRETDCPNCGCKLCDCSSTWMTTGFSV